MKFWTHILIYDCVLTTRDCSRESAAAVPVVPRPTSKRGMGGRVLGPCKRTMPYDVSNAMSLDHMHVEALRGYLVP